MCLLGLDACKAAGSSHGCLGPASVACASTLACRQPVISSSPALLSLAVALCQAAPGCMTMVAHHVLC